MKKLLIALVIIVFASGVMLAGCNKTDELRYDDYFNNFVSHKGFESVAESLTLGKDVFVTSYDQKADVFVINEKVKLSNKETFNIFGFATEEGVIIAPKYSYVLDIRHNYAIVVKSTALGANTYYRVGVVCIRGDKVGKEYGFTYEYNSQVSQYTFISDDYIVILGDKDYTLDLYNYATVYDYTSANGLLEVGRISNTTSATIFSMHDNYIAALGKSVVRYYYFDQIDENGYFVMAPGSAYTPFKEADGFEDMSLVTVSVYYIGNGWFVETGMYTSSKQFTGYEQTKKGANGTTYYYVNRSTRYNIRSGKRFDTDRVTLVANKYSSDYIKSMTNSLNHEVSISEDDKMPMYYQPIVPVSEIIKEGYSIVYYDFAYYDAKDELNWGQTFAVYDYNADIINLKDLLMPLLFVDGIGLQNSDPVYNIVGRDLAYHNQDGSIVTLMAVGNKYFYDPVIINDGMIIGYRADFNLGPQMFTSMMGAMSVDGQNEVPYEFVELTMFVDGYATGSKMVVTKEKKYREFYRISKSGVITKLENVYCLKNGMYITKEGEKYGLFANDGTRLLNAEYESLSIIENYLIDGVYFASRVVGIKDGKGVIFTVTSKS